MGKTADLTVVHKTIIDILHKEGKPQEVIAEEAGCSQSAVSKHISRKLSGSEKCGRKIAGMKWPFKSVGELHKEWTEAGVTASRATTHRRILDMGFKSHIPLVKPLLNMKTTSEALPGQKKKKKN